MCVFDFLFSLPVLVAVAWRFCMTNAQPPKKEEELGAKTLSLSLSAHRTQTRRKRGLFLVVLFSVCVPSVLAVSVCVLRPFVVDFGCFRGMDLLVVCVCVFVSSARSLSHFRFAHTVSVSVCLAFSPFSLLLLSLSLWSPPQFDYFYQKVLSFIMFCFASFNL